EAERIRFEELKPFLGAEELEAKILSNEVDEAYLKVLQEQILDPHLIKNQKPKVIFTPIHGTAAVSSVPFLRGLGVDLELVEAQLNFDPNFSSVHSPNPEDGEALSLGIELAKKVNGRSRFFGELSPA
ncbi:MAG: phospho-sugar mutase, partial [Bdellovibrionota bacterium]